MTFASFALDAAGNAVALRRDGSIVRQARNDQTGALEWQPVPLTGIDGRVVQVAVSSTGPLVALTSTGRLFRQGNELRPGGWHFGWQPIEAPQ